MKHFCNTYKHIVSGYLLLLTVVYVIGAKSFHTHKSAEVSLGVHNVQSAHPCDICEFQFTGPATISEAKLPSSFIANGLVLTPDIIVDIYSTDIESPSGRGPPALF